MPSKCHKQKYQRQLLHRNITHTLQIPSFLTLNSSDFPLSTSKNHTTKHLGINQIKEHPKTAILHKEGKERRKSLKQVTISRPTDGNSDDPTPDSVPRLEYHEVMDVIFHQVIRRRQSCHACADDNHFARLETLILVLLAPRVVCLLRRHVYIAECPVLPARAESSRWPQIPGLFIVVIFGVILSHCVDMGVSRVVCSVMSYLF